MFRYCIYWQKSTCWLELQHVLHWLHDTRSCHFWMVSSQDMRNGSLTTIWYEKSWSLPNGLCQTVEKARLHPKKAMLCIWWDCMKHSLRGKSFANLNFSKITWTISLHSSLRGFTEPHRKVTWTMAENNGHCVID